MRIHELYPFPEERKDKKRRGQGPATGQGCPSGRGHKGQRSRAGAKIPAWFEGGQMPLSRRLPKRGFKNIFRVKYEPVNLQRLLKAFEGKNEISLDDIYQRGLCKPGSLVKILGRGEVDRAVTIEAHRFSAQAAEKIRNAGGEAKALEG